MLTRCPNCETTFRVTPEQLKARHGKVRCGECQEVFDALDALIEAAPTVAAPTIGEPPQPTPELEPEVPARDEEAAPDAEVGDIAQVETGAEVEAEAEMSEPGPAPETEPELEPEPPAVPAPAEHYQAAEPPAEEWLQAPEAPTPRLRWPWALGSVAAILLLALQTVMHFRTEIAVLHPDTKPLLTAACEAFGCTLLLPRKAELMSIETSDLHPEAEGRLTLTATLKNRAPFAQEHPHLELTLTDTADKALVRRVLAPAEYLPAPERSPGFPAGKELPIELAIDAPGVPAAGYRLYLFYP